MKRIRFILTVVVLAGTFALFAFVPRGESYQLSTHVMDINTGNPMADVWVILYRQTGEPARWAVVDSIRTDMNGRVSNFLPGTFNDGGVYMLKFRTEPYYRKMGVKTMFPYVDVVFRIEEAKHYHIPLSMSPYGYSIFRGV